MINVWWYLVVQCSLVASKVVCRKVCSNFSLHAYGAFGICIKSFCIYLGFIALRLFCIVALNSRGGFVVS